MITEELDMRHRYVAWRALRDVTRRDVWDAQRLGLAPMRRAYRVRTLARRRRHR